MELGLEPGDVDVLLTHLHSDHPGLAPDAAGERGTIYISRCGPAVWTCPEQQAAHLGGRGPDALCEEGFPNELLAHIWDSNPAHSMAPPRGVPHACLEDGDVLEAGGYKLRCLLMPGHTPGQMCFWMEKQGLMFLGDHVLFDITPNITAWPDLPDALGAYLESLERIRDTTRVRSLPGHRGRGIWTVRWTS